MFFRTEPLEFSISLTGTNIIEAINKILFIAEKCKNPQLKGLCFLIKDNYDFIVIASDTFRLAAISFSNVVRKLSGKCDFFISLDQLPTFIAYLQSELVSFSVLGREIIFQDGLKISCLRNSPLSTYERLLPKPEKYQFSIGRNEIERFQDPINRNYLQFPLARSEKIVVNKEYLLDAFKILGGRLTMSIKGVRDPILIRGENKNIVYLLMPIAM